jgi:hypothetical protein
MPSRFPKPSDCLAHRILPFIEPGRLRCRAAKGSEPLLHRSREGSRLQSAAAPSRGVYRERGLEPRRAKQTLSVPPAARGGGGAKRGSEGPAAGRRTGSRWSGCSKARQAGSLAGKDPPGLSAVFENPTGFRSGLAWGFPEAFTVRRTPPRGREKNRPSFAAAHAGGNLGVCGRSWGRDADRPPGSSGYRPAEKSLGKSAPRAQASATCFFFSVGKVWPRVALTLPPMRFSRPRVWGAVTWSESRGAKFLFRPSARGAYRVVFLSDPGRACPLPPHAKPAAARSSHHTWFS